MKWVKNIGNDSVNGEAYESNLTQILSKRKINAWPNRKVKRSIDSFWETSSNLVRSSCTKEFYVKSVFKISQYSQEDTCVGVSS